MIPDVLGYTAATILAGWGLAHAVPTRQVVAGFDPVTADNRRIIVQEWLAEAFTMWGLAAFVAAATALRGTDATATAWMYGISATLLLALAALTATTGARTPV